EVEVARDAGVLVHAAAQEERRAAHLVGELADALEARDVAAEGGDDDAGAVVLDAEEEVLEHVAGDGLAGRLRLLARLGALHDERGDALVGEAGEAAVVGALSNL